MTTVILNSTDKNFIFEFSFSPSEELDSPPIELTPAEVETAVESNDEQQPIVIGTAPLTYLEVVAYREDYPDLRFDWKGYMKENQTIAIQVPPVIPITLPPPATTSKKADASAKLNIPNMEEDTNWCKGSFHLYQNSQTSDRFVWFDLNFGDGYEAVYEGCMVQFPNETV